MSDYVIGANFEAMAVAADALRAKAKLLREQVNQANLEAGPLRESWVQSGSSAAATYQEYWTKLQAGAQEVFQDVDRLGAMLHQARDLQAANETKFANQFG
jgi:uncharacterized protein YukE